MKILVINGPNLNMLGKRDAKQYGTLTLAQINKQLGSFAESLSVSLKFFHSNHEGEIIDYLQEETDSADGILINPGALTHYGYSLRDALIDTKLPIVEVHLSDIDRREDFRKIDVLAGIALDNIKGLQEKSYILGLEKLINYIRNNSKV
ncbi:3-dehydroquinate dehydratase [Candidatus Gottesmanbacteria bacterium]|nr:3-dehydroquinate dehydratase [Candidatus Gottesmanbacteria bacterium]